MAGDGVSSVNTKRISGLVSGMDTDLIVKGMLKIDQYRIDKLFKEKTRIGWKKDAAKEMSALLLSFRTKYMSSLTKESNMNSMSAYKIYSVKSDENSAVKLSASSEASEGTNVINSITSIATGANTASDAKMTGRSDLSLYTQLKDIPFTTPLNFVTPEGSTQKQISFKINNVSFTFNETDTLQKVFSTINNSEANVNISYSNLSDVITLKSKNLGTSSILKIENTQGNFFGEGSATNIKTGTLTNGTNAVLKINGFDIEKTTNTFNLDGIIYTLTDKSTAPINFTTTRDLDASVNKIKSFINSYNELIDKLYTKYDEKKYSEYSPLTDEERADLSDKEADKWDGLAKSGILKLDKNLGTLINGMRDTFFTSVEGTNIHTTNLGFKTGSYLEKGKIYIDDEKLKQALQDSPLEVAELFMKTSDSKDSATKFKESGIVARLTTLISNYSISETTSTYDEEIVTINDKMKKYTSVLEAKEKRYYAQFTRMEKIMQQMNSQSSWLNQQLGSGG